MSPDPASPLAALARDLPTTAGAGPGSSGFLLIENNREALLWRLALADSAVRSIDVQYYIWDNDESAALLFQRLLDAADRGVRVRLLVDDLALSSVDRNLAAISEHPHFELRLFNPATARGGIFRPALEFLFRFGELNRRMHNKLFVADGVAAVVGGRNIGNHYFGLASDYNFRDLDALAVGGAVASMGAAFDRYWNSDLALPSSALSRSPDPDRIPGIRNALASYLADHAEILAAFPARRTDWTDRFEDAASRLHPGEAVFLQDSPVPFRGEELRLHDMIRYLAGPSESRLLIVSPYLLPGPEMLSGLARTVARGVEVDVITASMAAGNHTVVHSHYRKYRRPILRAGADLFEYRHQPGPRERAAADTAPRRAPYLCLHMKAIVADRQRAFIGSLNLDPRALVHNTENGLLIESPGLAAELADVITGITAPENSWRLWMDDRDQMRWTSVDGTRTDQPARTFGQRMADFLYRFVPVEYQL